MAAPFDREKGTVTSSTIWLECEATTSINLASASYSATINLKRNTLAFELERFAKLIFMKSDLSHKRSYKTQKADRTKKIIESSLQIKSVMAFGSPQWHVKDALTVRKAE